MNYDEWMKEVDKIMISVFGLAHDDLPDVLWRDKFEDGLSPHDAIDCTMEDEWADEPMADIWFGDVE